jgi:hypothetical protein
MTDFNVSTASNTASNVNPQITNKVAAINTGTNLTSTAANQSAFSSYIGQALAQIGLANPTNATAPVIASLGKTNPKEQDPQKSISTFIQNLFSILTDRESRRASGSQKLTKQEAIIQYQSQEAEITTVNNDTPTEEKPDLIITYSSADSATVGNIVSNLQTLVKELNTPKTETEDQSQSNQLKNLENGFENILNAQGVARNDKSTLANFLQTLAQNLQGQSPLGIIINTKA